MPETYRRKSDKEIKIEKDQKPSDVVGNIAKRIEEETGPKPSWMHHLDGLQKFLGKVESGSGVRISGESFQTEEKVIEHPRNVVEALNGVRGGRYRYQRSAQSSFIQTSVPRLPTEEHKAVDQIYLSGNWMGGSQGLDEEVLANLRRISEVQADDFQVQGKSRLNKLSDSAEHNLKKVQEFGNTMQRWITEKSSLQYQGVHWSQLEQKPRAIPRVTLEVTRTLSNRGTLRLKGPNDFIEHDEVSYRLDSPDSGENLFKNLDAYIENIQKKQGKGKKG